MADRSIVELNEATELRDNGLTVVYQDDETRKIAGSALKEYARRAVLNYAEQAAALATADAQNAATAAQNAQNAAQSAETQAQSYSASANTSAQSAAQSAQNAAAAQSAIENMTVSSTTLSSGSSATVQKTESGGVVNLAFGIPQGAKGDPDVITSIERTSGTGSPGTTDTYTITTSTGATFTFRVYNGANGEGAGDMTKAVYDPTNKDTDIFAYAEAQAEARQAQITAAGLLKGTGTSVVAATANVDYATPQYVDNAVAAAGGTSGTQYTATLTVANWSADSYGYQVQSVAIAELLASYPVSPVIDVVLSGIDTEADTELLAAFGAIAMAQTSSGSLLVKAIGDAPTVNIPIVINVWE